MRFVPQIRAFTTYGNASVVIDGVGSLLTTSGDQRVGEATVTVTSEDGTTTHVYVIKFTAPIEAGGMEWILTPAEIRDDPRTVFYDTAHYTGTRPHWTVTADGSLLQTNGFNGGGGHRMTFRFDGAESIRMNALFARHGGFVDLSLHAYNPSAPGGLGAPVFTNRRVSVAVPEQWGQTINGVWTPGFSMEATAFTRSGLDPNQEYIMTMVAPLARYSHGSVFDPELQGWFSITNFVLNSQAQDPPFQVNDRLQEVFIGDNRMVDFEPDVFEYRIPINTAVNPVAPRVFALSTYGNATVEVYRPAPDSMFDGEYTVTVTVTSADGQNNQEYRFIFEGDPFIRSNIATLSSVSVLGIPIPDWDPQHFEYEVVFSPRVNRAHFPDYVNIVTTDPMATYTVRRTTPGIPTTMYITVTANDLSNTNVYRIDFVIGEPDGLQFAESQSWLGNTYSGNPHHVQNRVYNIVVTPDGDIRTWSNWDEGGRRHQIYNRDGIPIGNTDFSAAGGDPAYYARRVETTNNNGTTTIWRLGRGQNLEYPMHISGFDRWVHYAIVDHTIYLGADENDTSRPMWVGMVEPGTEAPGQRPSRPTAIGISNEGFLMVADDRAGQIIFYDVSDPDNPVVVHRFGSYGNISAGTPGLAFEEGYIKLFGQMSGIGMDRWGSLFISFDGNGGNVFFRRFDLDGIDPNTGMFRDNLTVGNGLKPDGTLSGEQQWFLEGYWCFLMDFDRRSVHPDDPMGRPRFMYGTRAIFELDPTVTTPGEEYQMVYYTHDRYRFPHDPRNFPSAGFTTITRNRWLDVTGNGDYELFVFKLSPTPMFISIYQFEPGTHLLRPVGVVGTSQLIGPQGPGYVWAFSYLPNTPSLDDPTLVNRGVIWRDSNGDGYMDRHEFTTMDPDWIEYLLFSHVDDAGNIFFTGLHSSIIYELPLIRFENGIPVYTEFGEQPTIIRHYMGEWFSQLGSIHHDYYNDVMYAMGWIPERPFRHMWQSVGSHIIRVDNWSNPAARVTTFSVALPDYVFDIGENFMAQENLVGATTFVVEEDLVFIAWLSRGPLGVRQGEVTVLCAHTGQHVGDIMPDLDLFGDTGWMDVQMGLGAMRLSEYSYMLLTYANYKGKNLIFYITMGEDAVPPDIPEPWEPVGYARPLPGAFDRTSYALTEDFWQLENSMDNHWGHSGNIVTFDVFWDDDYMYLGFQVLDDDIQLPPAADWFWFGDSIDVYISATNNTSMSFGRYDVQLVLPYGWLWQGQFAMYPGNARPGYLGPGMFTRYANLYDDANNLIGYTIKAAIPWANYTPIANRIEPGLRLGFDALNNDNTGSGPSWAGLRTSFANPGNFGDLILVPADFVMHRVTFMADITNTAPTIFATRDILPQPLFGIPTVSDTNWDMPRNPFLAGHSFGGWFTQQNGGGTEFLSTTVVTEDMTVYAYFIPNQIVEPVFFTVTFVSHGQTLSTESVMEGGMVPRPANPVQEGYTFDGWYTADGDLWVFTSAVTGNMSLYAKWTALGPALLWGDVNGDGYVNMTDLMWLNMYLQLGGMLSINMPESDVDVNGVITPNDPLLLNMYLAGMPVILGPQPLVGTQANAIGLNMQEVQTNAAPSSVPTNESIVNLGLARFGPDAVEAWLVYVPGPDPEYVELELWVDTTVYGLGMGMLHVTASNTNAELVDWVPDPALFGGANFVPIDGGMNPFPPPINAGNHFANIMLGGPGFPAFPANVSVAGRVGTLTFRMPTAGPSVFFELTQTDLTADWTFDPMLLPGDPFTSNPRSLEVSSEAPEITSANAVSFHLGAGGSHPLTAIGSALIRYEVSGAQLPAGVSISGTNLVVGSAVAPGDHVFTITARNFMGSYEQTFTLTITHYEIEISNPPHSATHTFPAVTLTEAGTYTVPAAHTVTITNTGNLPTGMLTITPADANFTVSPANIANILVGQAANFTIVPAGNLAAGTHTTLITIAGTNITTPQTFTASFTVNPFVPVPVFSISISTPGHAGTHTFPSVTRNAAGTYTAPAPHSVTITNTGNQPTGALTIDSSNTNFTVLPTSIPDLAVGAAADFTVTVLGNLSPGTHMSVITVDGANVTAQTFTIEITVNAHTPVPPVQTPVPTPQPPTGRPPVGPTTQDPDDPDDPAPTPPGRFTAYLADDVSAVMMFDRYEIELPQEFVEDAIERDSINSLFLLEEMHNLVVDADIPVIIRVYIGDLNFSEMQLLMFRGFVFDPTTGDYEIIPGSFSPDMDFFYFEVEGTGIIGALLYELPQPLLRLIIGQYGYYHNSTPLTSDVAPFITQNRTMVPIRLVAEALGATPRWDAATRTAYIYYGDIVLRLPVGQELPDGMGTPLMSNNRMLVPLRFVIENFGAVTLWFGEVREVWVFEISIIAE